MFLDLFGAKYAVEPLYGSTHTVHCGAHDEQAAFLLNKVIFGVSAKAPFKEEREFTTFQESQFSIKITETIYYRCTCEPFLYIFFLSHIRIN